MNTDEENIKAFLKHPARLGVSVRRIERMAKIPSATLRHFLAGIRKLPPKHIPAIENQLLHYGYDSSINYNLSPTGQ